MSSNSPKRVMAPSFIIAPSFDDDPRTWKRLPKRWMGSPVNGFPLEKEGQFVFLSELWGVIPRGALHLDLDRWKNGHIRWHRSGLVVIFPPEKSWDTVAVDFQTIQSAKDVYQKRSRTCESTIPPLMERANSFDDQNFIQFYGLERAPRDSWDNIIDNTLLNGSVRRVTGNFVCARTQPSDLPPLFTSPTYASGRRWLHLSGPSSYAYDLQVVINSMMEFRTFARRAGVLSTPKTLHDMHAHLIFIKRFVAQHLVLPLAAIVVAYLVGSLSCTKCKLAI